MKASASAPPSSSSSSSSSASAACLGWRRFKGCSARPLRVLFSVGHPFLPSSAETIHASLQGLKDGRGKREQEAGGEEETGSREREREREEEPRSRGGIFGLCPLPPTPGECTFSAVQITARHFLQISPLSPHRRHAATAANEKGVGEGEEESD